MVAERDGLLAFVEVKSAPELAGAAFALGPRQRPRLVTSPPNAVSLADPRPGTAGVRSCVRARRRRRRVRSAAGAFSTSGDSEQTTTRRPDAMEAFVPEHVRSVLAGRPSMSAVMSMKKVVDAVVAGGSKLPPYPEACAADPVQGA